MTRLELPSRLSAPLDLYQPVSVRVVVFGALYSGIHPDIELKQASVRFEPIPDLIFWRKEGPTRWERQVCHMCVLDRIVSYQCLIVLSSAL